MITRKTKNGVVYYRSTILKNPHGFSTRLGGVSSKAHLASMNLGQDRGDSQETLRENYRRFHAAAELPCAMVYAHQIHSDLVLTLDRMPDAAWEIPQCDGFVTSVPELTLAVKIADCLPVLLEDCQAGVIGAVHAGWRGSAKGIVLRSLEKMEALGAKRERIHAVIGPRIGGCCFEVKEDFVLEYLSLLGNFGKQFLYIRQDKTFCDLPSLNRELLFTGGVLPEHFEDSGLCTCCQPNVFFSHRASGGKRGTMAAMIALKHE
ncbi:MAG: peptidoglycan editing factor PgeF [Ruminococcaceae bacterium]|nr:peptidoglycan editing factor PgeF [Oscillospiraceae bacterium]